MEKADNMTGRHTKIMKSSAFIILLCVMSLFSATKLTHVAPEKQYAQQSAFASSSVSRNDDDDDYDNGGVAVTEEQQAEEQMKVERIAEPQSATTTQPTTTGATTTQATTTEATTTEATTTEATTTEATTEATTTEATTEATTTEATTQLQSTTTISTLSTTSTSDATYFPDFIMQQQHNAAFVEATDANCTITDPDLPGQYLIGNFPTSDPLHEFIGCLDGNFSKFPPGDSANQPETVACGIAGGSVFGHFPHTLQHLLQCWSLWRRYPNSKHVMLLDGMQNHSMAKGSSFNIGLTRMIRAQGIIVDSNFTEPKNYSQTYEGDANKLFVGVTTKFKGYKIADTEDLKDFRQKMLESLSSHRDAIESCSKNLHIDNPLFPSNATKPQQHALPMPRIVIINRKGARRLLAPDSIARLLQDELGLSYRPPVVYFESFSFDQQAETFLQADIVVTPHGAQSTSSFFMPQCGSLIESFPLGLDYPVFFGRLARISLLNHSYVYLGTNMQAEAAEVMKTMTSRKVARNKQLCLPAPRILEAVRTQIDEWRRCCGFGDEAAVMS